MIGMIVTGHGTFAQGITSSIELIAGAQDAYEVVNFEGEPDVLERDLKMAILALKDCENIVIFTDLTGGSPFKIASILASENDNIEVISGTNLSMLLEFSLKRKFETDVNELVEGILETGKSQIVKLDLKSLMNDEPDEETDGI